MLQEQIELFSQLGLVEGEWTARRVGVTEYRTMYWVQYRFASEAVDVGPEWLVQLASGGAVGPGAVGQVMPANALASYLMAPSAEILPLLNRSDEVLTALTNHRGQSGGLLGFGASCVFPR